jgi:preprotein translocase subunit SecG
MSGERSAGRAKILLIVTSVLFGMWIAAMLVMYFKTVYPQRHPATQMTVAPNLS